MAVFCTEVLNIQDVNQPKKACEGPVTCDFNEAFIFSVCSIGVKDGPITVPPGVVKAKKIFTASLTLNGRSRREKKKKKEVSVVAQDRSMTEKRYVFCQTPFSS